MDFLDQLLKWHILISESVYRYLAHFTKQLTERPAAGAHGSAQNKGIYKESD